MPTTRQLTGARAALAVAVGVLCACTQQSPPNAAAPAPAPPSGDDALAFLNDVETQYETLGEEAARISWVNATYINFDTNWLVANIDARTTELRVRYAKEAVRFDDAAVPPDARRKLDLLKLGLTLPAPDGGARELADITTRLDAAYSTGKIEFDGRTVPQSETESLMRTLRDPAKLEEVWTKWHDYAAGMKDDFAREVEIANQGARELGFADVGALWRSKYDMAPDEFAAEVDRLWGQVKPLYDELHCYVRAELNEEYGDDAVPLDQPIRADLLGNMWAQDWAAIYDIAAPPSANGDTTIDLDKLLVENDYDPLKMTQTAEAFFSSLGFEPLPETFWERSQITKPEGREVVCHASAWDLDAQDDLRIKMCMEVNAEDFRTVHHELGHNYYQRAYKDQPVLFRGGANDGFHEAIGDTVMLSITPEYLREIGLIDTVPDASQDLGLLMQRALTGVAFLPFGLLIDKWRWEVFSGEVAPDEYNASWWALREQYQGVRPPNERPAEAFDPGAKYHIPGNVPYMRYFLARVLQYQFYKAACDAAGWTGPLHRCSFYGSKEVGDRLNAMLQLGQSKPWPEALEAFTGTRSIDGSAILAYYAPLKEWLEEQNAGRTCGW